PNWAAHGVGAVRWRSMATFTLLPSASARPLALSAGGSCISFNRTHRQIAFQSLPIAVAGVFGQGRFALFGGTHAFETGTLGLLHESDNRRFIQNIAQWLLSEDPLYSKTGRTDNDHASDRIRSPLDDQWRNLAHVNADEGGEGAVKLVERLLRESGI